MRFHNKFSTRFTFIIFISSALLFWLGTYLFKHLTYYDFKNTEFQIAEIDNKAAMRDLNEFMAGMTLVANVPLKYGNDIYQDKDQLNSFLQFYTKILARDNIDDKTYIEPLNAKNKIYLSNPLWTVVGGNKKNSSNGYLQYHNAVLLTHNDVLIAQVKMSLGALKEILSERGIGAIEKYYKVFKNKKALSLGYYLLIDANGNILIDSTGGLTANSLNELNDELYKNFLHELTGYNKGKEEIEYTEETKKWTFKKDPNLPGNNLYFINKIKNTNLRLIMSYNTTNILKATHFIQTFQTTYLVLVVATLCFLLLVIWVVCHFMLRPLMGLQKDIKKVSAGEFKMNLKPLTRGDEIGELSRTFAAMVKNLRANINELAQNMAEKSRQTQELESAKFLQNNMFEYRISYDDESKQSSCEVKDLLTLCNIKELDERNSNEILAQLDDTVMLKCKKKLRNVTLYRRIIPARFVSGDFYTYMDLGDGKLFILVADVSGKGMPAAMMTTFILTVIRHYLAFHPNLSILNILEKLNQVLYKMTDSMMFVTMLCGLLDTKTGTLSLYNAGHLSPILIQDKSVDFFQLQPSYPLGVQGNVRYEEITLQLTHSASVIFYTDGITEASNAKNELFGAQRLLSLIKKQSSLNLELLVKEIEKEINEFSGNQPLQDDATLLLVNWHEDESLR